jgi:hypothetical protein
MEKLMVTRETRQVSLTVLAIFLQPMLLPAPARADVAYTETEGDDKLTVIRMTVTPAAESVPALQYRLAQPVMELEPGNAVPHYYRALLDLPRLMEAIRDKYDEYDKLSRWYATGAEAIPLADLPLDEARDASEMFDSAVGNHLEEAVRQRDCDWQLGVEEIRGLELISIHLSEFQNSREISRMLSLKTRLAIAERRYDDALSTMQMNLRLGSDVATEPFFVCGLIGIAISNMSTGALVELIAAPDSPNLYWALAELPEPLVDLRAAARFEADLAPRIFPYIHNAATTERSHDEWNRLYKETVRDFAALAGTTPLDFMQRDEVATAVALAGYPHAKAWLIDHGLDGERVEKMAVGQVIAIYTERTYERVVNEFEKLWYVPFWQAQPHIRQPDEILADARAFGSGKNREILPMGTLLIPAMQAVRTAQVRLQRDLAALRVIEALRMYAAEHDGRLPRTLGDIEQAPIPDNPATGEPFVYRLEDQTAILELPSSDGIPNYNRRFEIRIAANGN